VGRYNAVKVKLINGQGVLGMKIMTTMMIMTIMFRTRIRTMIFIMKMILMMITMMTMMMMSMMTITIFTIFHRGIFLIKPRRNIVNYIPSKSQRV
jgi:hypothetical protein